MKVLSIIFSVLLLVSCGTDPLKIGEKTTIEVEEVFDAGDVIKGEKIYAVFKIKNTGTFPLHIGEAAPSCSCTVTDRPTDPIAPGESGEIKATVETKNAQPGTLSKSVTIVANTDPSTTKVKIVANVMSK